MKEIPKDPFICLSFINTKLRDYYGSLDELCRGLEIDKQELINRLNEIKYSYDKEQNQFH